jgi:hypothetical protein
MRARLESTARWRFGINVGRTDYNDWEMDGGDNMDNGSNISLNVYPRIDAIAEFRVLTSNYGAQCGGNGSGTVEVETKSGTGNFQGDAYATSLWGMTPSMHETISSRQFLGTKE